MMFVSANAPRLVCRGGAGAQRRAAFKFVSERAFAAQKFAISGYARVLARGVRVCSSTSLERAQTRLRWSAVAQEGKLRRWVACRADRDAALRLKDDGETRAHESPCRVSASSVFESDAASGEQRWVATPLVVRRAEHDTGAALRSFQQKKQKADAIKATISRKKRNAQNEGAAISDIVVAEVQRTSSEALKNDLLKGLDEHQQRAVTTALGPTLVHAGPGSGKTRVLTHRIAYMVGCMGVPAASILAVTFTNKAANEMKERLTVLLRRFGGADANAIPRVGTFHSVCSQLLLMGAARDAGVEFDSIILPADALKLVKQIVLRVGPKATGEPGYYQRVISMHKMKQLDGSLDRLPLESKERFLLEREVFKEYQKELRRMQKLDFDDLLCETVRTFEQHEPFRVAVRRRFQHVLVDEWQDTNKIQFEFVRTLFGVTPTEVAEADLVGSRSLFVVGDSNQGIYAFRGADYRNVMFFKQQLAGAVEHELANNYRSADSIVSAARSLIEAQRQPLDSSARAPVVMAPTGRANGKIELLRPLDERDQARSIAQRISLSLRSGKQKPGDIAVLYRTKRQAAELAKDLVRKSVPFRIVGGFDFYEREEILDMLAYLRILANPRDDLAVLRVVNKPPRRIGQKSLDIITLSASEREMCVLDAIRELTADATTGAESGLTAKVRAALKEFVDVIDIATRAMDSEPAVAVADLVLEQIGFREYLRKKAEKEHLQKKQPTADDDFASRERNVDQLLSQLREFSAEDMVDFDESSGAPAYGKHAPARVSLGDFLRNIAMVSDSDSMRSSDDHERSRVLLMTGHASKGLEFDTVFIIGCNEGFFPVLRAMEDDVALEEERRVFYVALTRCKRSLFLSALCDRPRSRFIEDLGITLEPDIVVAPDFADNPGKFYKRRFRR
mmetsp:Transcript_15578/g.41945  ORF Transcript_15578/g.41945 Transcript_15578/m.41945 type:complete len:906 (+) Transcript_15578:193-2910(+)|eukprot:CAMPEP_0185840186 /NCGR_PEP_ID=MMETSP1353-20130828/15812_1 /TAXON_ID=1077150 /ORGANISM="Erythrolobus australicus, Strain CCMP3124" /LENGTH=905 /DNA_ID=CAMNT_0028539479 /DNA_START=165 /DNA_END=2882 /DNA_ORIENTATION=+